MGKEAILKANNAYLRKNDEQAVKYYYEAINLGANLIGVEHV